MYFGMEQHIDSKPLWNVFKGVLMKAPPSPKT